MIGICRAVTALPGEVGYKVTKVMLKWTWMRMKTETMKYAGVRVCWTLWQTRENVAAFDSEDKKMNAGKQVPRIQIRLQLRATNQFGRI
jgi:hypothetical protein